MRLLAIKATFSALIKVIFCLERRAHRIRQIVEQHLRILFMKILIWFIFYFNIVLTATNQCKC